MKFYKTISMVLVICLNLLEFSCSSAPIVKERISRDENPTIYEKERKVTEDTKGKITKRVFTPSEVNIVSSLPKNVSYGQLKLSNKYSVLECQEIARKTGLSIISLDEPALLATKSLSGKWYYGWVPPGTLMFAIKKITEDGTWEYNVVQICQCGNEAASIKICITPGKLETEKVFTDTVETVIVEEYTDVREIEIIRTKHSKWPWIIAGALAAGLIACLLTGHRDRDRPEPEDENCGPGQPPAR